MVATPSRFLTLNKVTFLQNTATESNPRAGARLRPEQRLPGARESLRTRPGCGSPCHTNSPAPARVPQEGGGFPGSAGPRVGRGGAGKRCPGKGPDPRGPAAHRPGARSPARPRAAGCRLAREVPAPRLPEAPRSPPSCPHQPPSCPRPPARSPAGP